MFLKLLWLGGWGCHPQKRGRWQEIWAAPGSWLCSCPSFPEFTSAMLLLSALACSTLQGGYLLFVSYLGTQAGLIPLKGLAAGEAGGGGGPADRT